MQSIKVVKIGGHVLNTEAMLDDFIVQFAQLEGPKMLVHGGGKLANRLAEKLGITVQMKDGRRITDDDMLEVVVMTYGGLVNRQLVAQLQKRGVQAIGLTGADGNILVSRKREPVNGLDYGWVGDPYKADVSRLLNWMEEGLVPIIAPLTHDGAGHLLNTNADTMAQFLSVALAKKVKVHLIYAFELPGVLEKVSNSDSLIKAINLKQYKGLKAEGVIHSGMIPKLDNAFEALNAGISTVSLVKYDLISKIGKNNFDGYTRLYQ